MNQKQYGPNFQEHLLEEYKLYVQMADNVTSRRLQANSFFITVMSALLVFLSYTADNGMPENIMYFGYMLISILGVILSVVWYVILQSYRQLNSGKFKVIHELESQLPFPCYDSEWENLSGGGKSKKYIPFSQIEQFIPFIMAIPFFLMLVYAIYSLTAAQ